MSYITVLVFICPGASLVAQWQRIHLPMQGTQVQSLGWEDPIEKSMATCFSIPAWETPWTEEPGGLLGSLGVPKTQTWLSAEQQQLICLISGFKVLKKTPIYTVQLKIIKTTLVGEHVGIVFCCREGDFSPWVLGCLGERLLQGPSYRICTCVRWVWCEFMEVEVSSWLDVLFLSKAKG